MRTSTKTGTERWSGSPERLRYCLHGALIWLVPFIWTVLMSVRPPDEPLVSLAANGVTTVNIFTGSHSQAKNFSDAAKVVNWGQEYHHHVDFCIRRAGRAVGDDHAVGLCLRPNAIFRQKRAVRLILVQLMIPSAVLLVPNFATIRSLGCIDTKLALMLPYFGSAFGTFLMRQTFRQVPLDLEDAARMDGCNWFGILRNVYLPSSIPTLTAFALVSISAHWNEFLWPLIVTKATPTAR